MDWIRSSMVDRQYQSLTSGACSLESVPDSQCQYLLCPVSCILHSIELLVYYISYIKCASASRTFSEINQ